MTTINTPCKKEVECYLNKWNKLGKYYYQEESLNKLFFELMPENKKIEEILIKVSALNDFYSTNIYSTFDIAEKILELDIDKRLKEGDSSLVSDIGHISISKKSRYFYSFASKYCSHHQPEMFPIYDRYVDKVLMYFKKKDKFDKFIQKDLKNYKRFKEIIVSFAKFYSIDEYGFKDLDRYIWQLGKKHFDKKY